MKLSKIITASFIISMLITTSAYADPVAGPAGDPLLNDDITIEDIETEEEEKEIEAEIIESQIPESLIGENTENTSDTLDITLNENIEESLEETETVYTGNKRNVTINVQTEFTFDTAEDPVYAVQLLVPNGLSDSDGQEDYEVVVLSKDDNFSGTYTFPIYYDDLQITAEVVGDTAYLYNILLEGFEEASFMGSKIRNSGIVYGVKNGNTYDLKLVISQNEDAVVKDANTAPTISDFYKKVSNGKFGESRSEEIENPENEVSDDTMSSFQIASIIFVVVLGVLVVIGVIVLIFVKIRREQDED